MSVVFPDKIDTDSIEDLVEKYEELNDYERRQTNEATVRQQYLNPLFRALGWDTTTDQVKPEQRTLVGDVDYALSLSGREQFFVEAKRFSADLDGTRRVDGEKQPYVEQAINYAWHQGCDWAVLTNFKELRLYFTHVSKDDLEKGRVMTLSADEYVTDEGVEKLSQLSKMAVEQGSLEQLERRRERDSVTVELQNVLSEARVKITRDVHDAHPDKPLNDIREGVQRILDRLVVMRVAEDRGVIQADTLLIMAETWEKVSINTNVRSLVRDLKNAFRDFDSVYNSELFDKHECEEYDLSNDVLRETIDNLYEYNFGYLDADVLGSIYEDYIGHAIEEKGQGLDLVTQPDERREGGVYYTPVPVVEYIVESTVGERIENIMVDVREELNSENPDFEAARARFDEIQELKIVDVTCGSGSFLIKAYDLIVEAYQEFDELRRNVNGDMGVQQYSDALTIPDNYKKEILNKNIYGVDLDYQATEIATVNLLLKALDQGEKLPAILEDNIKNGNSLLNGSPEVVADTMDIPVSEAEEIKAFDWESEFHDVFAENGGFDVIIGNPPWGADTREYSDWLESDAALELAEGQYDTYELFLELGSELLNNSGTLGFIIPDTVINRDSSPLREWLVTEKKLDCVYKLGEGIFDNVFAGTSILQYTNTAPSADNEVQVGLIQKEDRKRMMGSRGEALSNILEEKTHTTRQSRFQDDSQHSIPVWAGEKDYTILDVMEENTVDWSNVIDNGRGDEIGRDGQIMQCPYCMGWDTYPQKRAESKGGGYYAKTCSHSDCGEEYEFEEAISTREIIKDTQTEECDTPIYFGEHINRYRVTDQAYIDQDVDGVGLKDDWRYTPPKLVIRQASVGFFATVDNTDARCLQAVFSFRPKNERDEPFDKYDIEYFLGFLNSRAMLYYYAKTEGITEWQSYPRHTQTDIMSLPVPEVDFTDDEKVEEYNEFVSLVRDAIGQNNNKVNQGLDWEIEEKVLDLYEIPDENRPRMWGELKKMQRLRILRELFPNVDDD